MTRELLGATHADDALPHPPDRTVAWADMPAKMTLDIVAEHPTDLAALDWQPSQERYASTDVLRVALRHGVPCSTGIVLAGGYVATQGWADQIRTAHHESEEGQRRLQPHREALRNLSSPVRQRLTRS